LALGSAVEVTVSSRWAVFAKKRAPLCVLSGGALDAQFGWRIAPLLTRRARLAKVSDHCLVLRRW
jgi:hypothetical protein